jgi:dTDP-4-amino-4,6-dideoxygalactose transaminase
MIPRVQPNYSLLDLLSSFFIFNNTSTYRNKLICELKNLYNSDYILLTPSGRGSIYIILSCIEQKKIFVPAYTCKAVIEACKLANKEIFFVETEDNSFNIDPKDLVGRLDSDSALLMTHQFGFPSQASQLLEIANGAGAIVLEDCAASFGGKCEEALTGTFGLASAFSFDSTKLLNAPLKGGFILTSDQNLFCKCQEFIDKNLKQLPLSLKIYFLILAIVLKIIGNQILYKLFHWLKFKRKGLYTDESKPSLNSLGFFYKFNMAEFQAAILLKQTSIINKIISKRRNIYNFLLDGLKENKSLVLPPTIEGNGLVPIRFPVLINGDKYEFYERCAKNGLDLGFSFTFIESPVSYGKSHRIASRILNLPFYFNMSEKTIKSIIRILNNISEK